MRLKNFSQTVTSEVIDTLKNNPEAANWVQAGMALHQHGDFCFFCGGLYTESRAARLDRHFDESLRKIQSRIDVLIDKLHNYLQECDRFIESLEPPSALDAERAKDWLDTSAELKAKVGQFKHILATMMGEVSRKNGSLFEAIHFEVPDGVETDPGKVSSDAIYHIIDKHNYDVDNFDILKKQVCNDVVQYYVEQCRTEYYNYQVSIENEKQALNEAEDKYKENIQALKSLNMSRRDHAHFAELLNDDLQRYFGHSELSFELSDDQYSIKRCGRPAQHLSEGERRSIALLYFLRDIESGDGDLRYKIVVLDDPVSSVDDNSATGAYSYIWAKCVRLGEYEGAGQLFILTHNFDFLRRWVKGIQNVQGKLKKIGGYSIRELRAAYRQGPNTHDRTPVFLDWTDPRKYNLLRSEYHYLFWRAATQLQDWERSLDEVDFVHDAAILPNVCRRLLEGFLSFRYPQKVGDFRAQMSLALDHSTGSADRTYIVKFLHEYSHNEQCDLNKPIQVLETPKVLRAIFELLRDSDSDHYRAMCEALEVDPLGDSVETTDAQ